jgi:hypothetical protein
VTVARKQKVSFWRDWIIKPGNYVYLFVFSLLWNRKFREEEVVASFLSIRHGPHRKWRVQQTIPLVLKK